jgi:DNA-binding NtrC family response regulator
MNDPTPARAILVVDDDDSIRSVVEICLKRAGHRVVSATGRSQVMALLKNRRFDLVITDMLMPDFDGPEVIQALQRYQPDAGLITMSGGSDMHSGYQSAGAGGGLTLMKPFHLDKLLLTVDQALNARSLP